MPELIRRTLVAVAGVPLTIYLIYAGGAVLATAIGVVAAIGAWEFFRMSRASGAAPFDRLGIVVTALIPIAVHAHYLRVFTAPLALGAFAIMLLLTLAIPLRGVSGKPLIAVGVTLFGILYPAMLTYIYPLRYHDYAIGAAAGTVLVMLPVAVTWAGDTGAYVFGRMWGRRKLVPSVSPAKTVEGAVGGLVVAFAACWLYADLVLRPYAELALSVPGMLLFAVSIGVVGQAGDLAESLLKRDAQVKDSSKLFPGHGGILDRFDSLLFVLPTAYLILRGLLIPAPGGVPA